MNSLVSTQNSDLSAGLLAHAAGQGTLSAWVSIDLNDGEEGRRGGGCRACLSCVLRGQSRQVVSMYKGGVAQVVGAVQGGVEAGKVQDGNGRLVEAHSVAFHRMHQVRAFLQLRGLLPACNHIPAAM